MHTTVAILTCVSNGMGIGPGHTAIVFGSNVYSFEDIKDYGSSNSGWLVFALKKYLKTNAHRPVILQELNSKVDAKKAHAYVDKSILRDDDYLSSGVCSSQVANAINSAYVGWFNPMGVDTPHKVFILARNFGLVSKTTLTWTGKGGLSAAVRGLLEARLWLEYPKVS